MKKTASLLVVGAFCPDVNLWQMILADALDVQLQVVQSDLNERGERFYFHLELSGEWPKLAKFELALTTRRKTLADSVSLEWMRTEANPAQEPAYLPYLVEVVSSRNPELISALTHFFTAKTVMLKDLRVRTFTQAKTGVPLQVTYLTVWIPLELSLPELRENFMLLCDEYNLDALFELERV